MVKPIRGLCKIIDRTLINVLEEYNTGSINQTPNLEFDLIFTACWRPTRARLRHALRPLRAGQPEEGQEVAAQAHEAGIRIWAAVVTTYDRLWCRRFMLLPTK